MVGIEVVAVASARNERRKSTAIARVSIATRIAPAAAAAAAGKVRLVIEVACRGVRVENAIVGTALDTVTAAGAVIERPIAAVPRRHRIGVCRVESTVREGV